MPQTTGINANLPPFDVLYQDPWILAVNKRAYIPVAPSLDPGSSLSSNPRGEPESLLEQVQRWLYEQGRKEKDRSGTEAAVGHGTVSRLPYLGLVHRIDQPVTGVVLFARDPETLELLNRQFRERKVHKLYWAVTEAKPEKDTGTLEHYILFDPKRNKSRIVHPATTYPPPIEGRQNRGKQALLHYRVVGSSEHYFFIEIELITGRPHQIRAQLSAIGCPVKEDLKYGARRSNPGGGILLHARSVRLIHPRTGDPITLMAEPPCSTLWALFPRSS